ncbi:MAG: hypothetical protein ACF8R7_01235 [Phycisphaerales bacterium JB039]
MTATHTDLLARLRSIASEAGVFGDIVLEGHRLQCEAADAGAPAFYRVDLEPDAVWVSLVTEDRWLSESIESDLMHSGDKLEELIEEELVDQGEEPGPVSFEHFRSEDMLFTFRTRVPARSASSAAGVGRYLLAYEACFRNLGDMSASGDDE